MTWLDLRLTKLDSHLGQQSRVQLVSCTKTALTKCSQNTANVRVFITVTTAVNSWCLKLWYGKLESNGNLCMFHMCYKADVLKKICDTKLSFVTNWLISSQDPRDESREENLLPW